MEEEWRWSEGQMRMEGFKYEKWLRLSGEGMYEVSSVIFFIALTTNNFLTNAYYTGRREKKT